MQKPKAILFDWDGTIVDTRQSILCAINKTLKDFGKPEIKDYKESGKTLEIISKIFDKDDLEKVLLAFKFNLKNQDQDIPSLFPYVLEFLEKIKKAKIKTGIVSNKFCDLLKREVELTNLAVYFDTVVGSGDTDQDKPSAKPLLYALSKINIKPNQKNVVFIGDSILDAQCAKKADVKGIIYGTNKFEEFKSNKRITTYKDLIDQSELVF